MGLPDRDSPGPHIPLAAYGWEHAVVTPITGGLINQTYLVVDRDERAILQRLHPIFAPEVNLDIDRVTSHLAAKGLVMPRVIRTRDAALWVVDAGHTWRALTFVEGESVHAVPSPAWAEAAGQLIGELHRALGDLAHTYQFARVGVHDTPAHLAKLTAHAAAGDEHPEARELAHEILAAAAALPPLPATPRRHCHGDLKISNILFARSPVVRATSVVDLDTVGLSTMAFELGDAMRSWCNPRGEDAGSVTFDLAIFEAAIRGFRSVAEGVVSADERRSIVIGLETVCLELAARFCVDVFRDDYFGWDPARFPSRRAHNFVRARGQLALALQVREARSAALSIVLG